MNVTVRSIVVAACLSCVALLGACGSQPAGTASPSPTPPKTQTPKLQATAYLKAVTSTLNSNPKLWADSTKFMSRAANGFSVAAKINNSYLPALEQMQAALASMDPPPVFRVAHARIRQLCATMDDTLYYLQDAIRHAVFTAALPPAFSAAGRRYMARLKKETRESAAAIRTAARRSGVKVPSGLNRALS
jgi:hypothetical protein